MAATQSGCGPPDSNVAHSDGIGSDRRSIIASLRSRSSITSCVPSLRARNLRPRIHPANGLWIAADAASGFRDGQRGVGCYDTNVVAPAATEWGPSIDGDLTSGTGHG